MPDEDEKQAKGPHWVNLRWIPRTRTHSRANRAVAVNRVLAWLRTAKIDRTAAKPIHTALGAKHLYEEWIQS